MKFLHKLEKICAFVGFSGLRMAWFLYYLRGGIALGYPFCCIAQFAWDVSNRRIRGNEVTQGPAVKRGSIFAGIREDGTKKLYVPCSYHKGRHPNWKAWNDRPRRQFRLFSDEIGRL